MKRDITIQDMEVLTPEEVAKMYRVPIDAIRLLGRYREAGLVNDFPSHMVGNRLNIAKDRFKQWYEINVIDGHWKDFRVRYLVERYEKEPQNSKRGRPRRVR